MKSLPTSELIKIARRFYADGDSQNAGVRLIKLLADRLEESEAQARHLKEVRDELATRVVEAEKVIDALAPRDDGRVHIVSDKTTIPVSIIRLATLYRTKYPKGV